MISVVLPAFREKENVVPLALEVQKHLAGRDHEILIVDDNSQDGTDDAIRALNNERIKCISRKSNRGFAFSIREGIEKSVGDILVVMDSDFNHDPAYLPMMVDNIKYYDCVLGSRFQYGGLMENRLRFLLSWVFNVFTRICTWGMITDSLYGFYAIKRSTLMALNFDKIFWGYGDYCIRLVFYLTDKQARILQFPAINGTRRYGRGASLKKLFSTFLEYTTAVLQLSLSERIFNGSQKNK